MAMIARVLKLVPGLFVAISGMAGPAQTATQHHEALRNSQFKVLRGMTVENYDGQKLGGLKDFVLDPLSGRVEFAIIKSGGTGPFSRQKIAPGFGLSLESVKLRTLSLDISDTRWAKAPVFERKHLQDLSDPARRLEIAGFYHFVRPVQPAEREPSLSPTGRNGEQKKLVALASDLIGKEIVDADRHRLGKISDLLVDTGSGKGAFILFSADNNTKPSGTFAVPLRNAFQIDRDRITVRARHNDLDRAPAFQWKPEAETPVYRYLP
jgi:sporulation protein YlmC with PRC-barrel domain